MRKAYALGILLVVAAVPLADRDATCDAEDPFQYLRRLSLDLRQRPPSLAEYEALGDATDVPEATIDALLADPDLGQLVRAYHRDLLWPALRKGPLFGAMAKLDDVPGDPNHRLFVAQDLRSSVYRGNPSGRPCADRRQLKFDADGLPERGSDGLDGWVEVEPYWAPGTTVRVCAYDAQASLVVPARLSQSGKDVPCTIASGAVQERRCGCGPHLDLCATEDTQQAVLDALPEQALRFAEAVGTGDRPYTDLVLARDIEVNGVIAHYLRWQWGSAHDDFLVPDAVSGIPEMPWNADWRTVERGAPHAGLLTSPLYLLRFPTNRSRAHRWLGQFLCSPLLPPPGGLKIQPTDEPDVAKRPGCSYCHATLEPAAAHWARFSEQGASWLDPVEYPVDSAACRDRAWADDPLTKLVCQHLYVIEREPRGILRSLEFGRDGSPEAQVIAGNADSGPRALVEAAMADGRFAGCTVDRWWRWLMRRPPTDAERAEDLPAIEKAFADGGFRLRALLKALVSRPAYRRGATDP